MFVRTTSLVVLLGLMWWTTQSCGSDDDESPDETVGAEVPDTSGSPIETPVDDASQLLVSVQDMCNLAVRPTYLPWLEAGETPLESGPVSIGGQSSLQWYEGPDSRSGASVTLVVSLERPSAAAEPLDLLLEGIPTTFGTAPSSGGVLVWDVNRQECRGVGLTLDNVPELSEAEVRQELTRIAEGLEPR